MRQLAQEYYWQNGSLDGITNSDVGVNGNCTSNGFYYYNIRNLTSTSLYLSAARCMSGGKSPNGSRFYDFYLAYYPGTGQSDWHCYWNDDASSCFGLPI